MKYPHDCYTHGRFDVEAPITEGPPDVVYCPECHEESMRVYSIPPVRWDTDGAHGRAGHWAGNYDATGDKLEKLNKNWSKKYGEKPPAAAKDIPRNSTDPH